VAGRVLASPNLSGGFDGILLVIHASRTSKSTARKTTDDLLGAGTNLLGVVLNGVNSEYPGAQVRR
jgi:protein-tyrosine kinase